MSNTLLLLLLLLLLMLLFKHIHIFATSAHQILHVFLSFRPSVRLHEPNSHWKYFGEFRYFKGGGAFSRKNPILLKSDTNIGHFT
jgi:hypothetical protein